MFNSNRHSDWPILAPIVAPIVNQTCTFQCLLQMNNLLKYDQCGHASPSGLLLSYCSVDKNIPPGNML